MKKYISLFLCITVVAFLFAGCGNDRGRNFYNLNLSKYVTVKDYKEIKVDTSSEEYKKYYDSVLENDVEENDFYVKKTEGTVEQGDTANIDYVGKKDGVAFAGGTASGYDLEIGSGSFIEGFEEGLVGVAIGDTVDLNLTFPEQYHSEELAGKAVVFTVKVNYVKTSDRITPEEYYKQLGYKSYEKYNEAVTEKAVKHMLVDKAVESSTVNKYPDDDKEKLYNNYYELAENQVKSTYGIDLESFLSSNGSNLAKFKEDTINEYVFPMMQSQMPVYYILDKEGLKITPADVDRQIDEMVKRYSKYKVTKEDVVAQYGDYYFEYLAVREKVEDFLYDNADIK